MPAPTEPDVTAYLVSADPQTTWEPAAVASALAAEKRAQARRCRVPADADAWDADLVEALFRRVARNLAVRPLPLGFVPGPDTTDGAAYLGSSDPEVRRLEAPFRKRLVG